MGIIYSFCKNIRTPSDIQNSIKKERERDISKIWNDIYDALSRRADNAKSGEDEYIYLPEYNTITIDAYSKKFSNHEIEFPYYYTLKVGDKKEYNIRGTVVYLEIILEKDVVVYRIYR
jgi:hypothetical protein